MIKTKSKTPERPARNVLDAILTYGLIVIFGLIVLHAPLSVYFGTVFPRELLIIKSWKELAMGALLIVAVINVTRHKAWRTFLRDPIILVSAGLALLYIVNIRPETGARAYGAGLLIDLRYVLYLVLVYVAARLYPDVRRSLLGVGLVGAVIVTWFGLLQFLLPKDFLTVLGYSRSTIAPYTTIDSYEGLVRLQSTLRGPNPLGAYASVVALIATAVAIRTPMRRSWQIGLVGLAVAATVLVFASYSRSAYLGLAVGAVVAGAIMIGKRRLLTLRTGVIGLALLVVVTTGLFAIRSTSFYASVLNHEVAGSGPDVNSNEGHGESLAVGWSRVVTHPFGYGTGSTGSASLLSDASYIVENQFLYVAHEAGWGALVLFLVLVVLLLSRAYRNRDDPVAIGVLASGIGLLVIGLVLPVFADDTVSIVWFGLAGLVAAYLGQPNVRKNRYGERITD